MADPTLKGFLEQFDLQKQSGSPSDLIARHLCKGLLSAFDMLNEDFNSRAVFDEFKRKVSETDTTTCARVVQLPVDDVTLAYHILVAELNRYVTECRMSR